jgi:Glycosyltransferase (GlcNAc)
MRIISSVLVSAHSSAPTGSGDCVPERIYVQIPAYRDLELLPTVMDLLARARHPERLTIGVAWQFGPGDGYIGKALLQLPNVKVLSIPAAESLGCNWARQLLQKRWDGQEYTLFLDSHHRFVSGWDESLVRMHRDLQDSGVEKPILTSYLPPYDPAENPAGWIETVYRMAVAERRWGMPFQLTGHPVRDWRRLTSPLAAYFVSLHMLFAEGAFNMDVPFDPRIYFFADEVAIALRAYTHGYDLFHPNVVLGWHLYDRRTRTTHWADHSEWERLNEISIKRLRQLFSGVLMDEYAVGGARTISEYESYAQVTLLNTPRTGSG